MKLRLTLKDYQWSFTTRIQYLSAGSIVNAMVSVKSIETSQDCGRNELTKRYSRKREEREEVFHFGKISMERQRISKRKGHLFYFVIAHKWVKVQGTKSDRQCGGVRQLDRCTQMVTGTKT